MRPARFLKRFMADRRGAAFIEMALVLPLLFLLVAGVLEFGRMLYHNSVIEAGLRDAGRYLSRVPTVGQAAGTPCADDPATAAHMARNLVIFGSTSATGTPLIPYFDAEDYGAICISGPTDKTLTVSGGGTAVAQVLELETTVVYEGLALFPLLGISDVTMRAHHEQVWIGE